jgi:hypothetical protein
MAGNRNRRAERRERRQASKKAATRFIGLRWVPVPLAMLLAVLGWLVFGTVLGQQAVASSHAGLQAGGLKLTVNQVLWMSDDMNNPGQATDPNSFTMPDSMMPGMQTNGDKRLRLELYIHNISTSGQQYAWNEFRLFGTGGKSWAPLDNAATREAVQAATLAPGFQTTIDLYFDVPASQGNRLSAEFEHGGTTVTFPVHVSGSGSGAMAGM